MNNTDLEKRIEEVILSNGASWRGLEELAKESAQDLTQLFIEWAEGCVPNEKLSKTGGFLPRYMRGFNDCRTQTLTNVKGDSK